MGDRDPTESAIRERAYFIWEREGRPEGRAHEHWMRAVKEQGQRQAGHDEFEEEEKILAGHPDANLPAMLTKDVPGG